MTDALALIPLLHPGTAQLLWGLEANGGAQRFAARSAAALMAGWTMLLWWASRRPLELRDVAPVTLLVIAGFILAEIAAATANVVPLGKMIPTWILLAIARELPSAFVPNSVGTPLHALNERDNAARRFVSDPFAPPATVAADDKEVLTVKFTVNLLPPAAGRSSRPERK